jgi:myo-inositol 2-dehydrogenase/D-chiro-inositol 1-dehydrogenase
MNHTRRDFFALSAAAGLSAAERTKLYAAEIPNAAKSKNDRARIGSIGLRYQGSVITEKALPWGDVTAVCDVDRHVMEQARASFGSLCAMHEDYRKLLDRKDVDVVMIGSPDHWHAKMAIDAMNAGKDVYLEKPLTLTIAEGMEILTAAARTKRVVQVGTWQRSDANFRQACEIARSGRIGKISKVDVVLGKNKQGGPFESAKPPSHFNWELWQGQTPSVAYIPERTHYTFRWWLEYSGGQMTDWGAHHVDIALWGLGVEPKGKVVVSGSADFPNVKDGYNVPKNFSATLAFDDGRTINIADHGSSGVTFHGSKGMLIVDRSKIAVGGDDAATIKSFGNVEYKLYADEKRNGPPRVGKLASLVDHMDNFFSCIRSRRDPISDVLSQHRSVTACHLVNIALRLGRPITWDLAEEKIIGDPEAAAMTARAQRKGYEVRG